MGNMASAHPSKAFFVAMLTRDIELGDAILDLIDNCLDGVHRMIKNTPPKDASKPFTGFEAELWLDRNSFSIVDNCGGIPHDIAEKYAFRLGRPARMPKETVPTVGVYGIGMKRAIFKMGRSGSVTTAPNGQAYQVSISSKWMESDDDWDLPITDLAAKAIPAKLKGKKGTLVEIGHLMPGVSQEFDSQATNFIATLNGTIATHYSYVIHKGFSIKLNGKAVVPKALSLLVSHDKNARYRIEPFVYKVHKDGIAVDLVIGLYRKIPSEKEIQDELEGMQSTGSKDTCGWTVICNDRVVVYNDKSRLTGWGEATVPSYHPQFNAIAGIVRFQSNDMAKLPVTTTKRGLEGNSELYLAVKDSMREGLKHFTSFTNHWKSRGVERDALMRAAAAVDPFRATKHLAADRWMDVRKGLGGKKYIPPLPKPTSVRESRSETVIKFMKSTADVDAVAELLFGDTTVGPNKVGEACFDKVLERAKR